jgi:peptidoglycan/xylan/chitin deacetylase (PgdA/CDA1 family)
VTISAVMFHHFHDEKRHIKVQGSIDGQSLHRLLISLQSEYTILHPVAYSEKLLSGELSSNEICLTFDDALKCQVDIALPVLKQLNLNAFFFVYSKAFHGPPDHLEVFRDFRHRAFKDMDAFYGSFFMIFAEHLPGSFAGYMKNYPNDYLSNYPFYTEMDRRFRYVRDNILSNLEYDSVMFNMIKDRGYSIEEHSANLFMSEADLHCLCSAGNVIGLHSNSHPTTIDKYSYNDQWSEYHQNKTFLEKSIGSEIWAMSHPCGRYNQDTLRVLNDLGVKIGFRSSLANGLASPLEIPREDHANLLKRLA